MIGQVFYFLGLSSNVIKALKPYTYMILSLLPAIAYAGHKNKAWMINRPVLIPSLSP